jgi:HEPN domain-containing protein
MPPRRSASASALAWLSRARGDLALARAPLPQGGYLDDLCYHAQQAAEKALKAVHIHQGLA